MALKDSSKVWSSSFITRYPTLHLMPRDLFGRGPFTQATPACKKLTDREVRVPDACQASAHRCRPRSCDGARARHARMITDGSPDCKHNRAAHRGFQGVVFRAAPDSDGIPC